MPDGISHRFADLKTALRIKGVRFYDLRHYGATQALDAGINVKTVQAHLRHSTSRMTLDRYAKSIEASDREATRVIAATLVEPTK